MITKKQAKTVLPAMRAAVASLHQVWEKCREVEKALGRDMDTLESIIHDMAAGLDHAESLDAAYVRVAINAQLDEVGAASACPKCGERRVDALAWEKDEKHVKCSTCGKRYEPPVK